MKIEYWCLGKTDESYLEEGIQKYIKKLKPYLSFQYREIPASKAKNANADQHRSNEKEEILKLLKASDVLILLDEKGEYLGSEKFAAWMQKKFNSTSGNIIFLSGGAYGFHEEIYKRSNAQLALSEMTFTHQMVRLVFLEQLYRAMTILKGEPYHH